MTSISTMDRQAEIRVLETAEVDCVAGGYIMSPVDVSQMPDRMVGGCGTMWWQDRLIKIFTGSRP